MKTSINMIDEKYASLVHYKGYRLLPYKTGRFIYRWNVSVSDLGDYKFGDPFNSISYDRAIAKAKAEIDRVEAIVADSNKRIDLLYSEETPCDVDSAAG